MPHTNCVQSVLWVLLADDSRSSAEQHFDSGTGRPPGALTLSEPGASLIRSMLLRAAYGGMQGDVTMMRRFAALWMARHAFPTCAPRGA